MSDQAAVARARVDDLLERLAHVNLQVVVVAPPDSARRSARDQASAAAIAAGRGGLFDEAVAAARDSVLRAFSRGGFSGTWAATDWSISVMRPADRVAAAAAFEEAAMAEVVEDLVDEETLVVLRSTSHDLIRSSELPTPGTLSSFAGLSAIAASWTAQRAIVAASVIVGIGLSFTVGLGLGLLAIAVGVALARLRGSAGSSGAPPV